MRPANENTPGAFARPLGRESYRQLADDFARMAGESPDDLEEILEQQLWRARNGLA